MCVSIVAMAMHNAAFKLSVETPSAAPSFFCASHVRFPGVGDVSKTRSEAWEQFGAAWYGQARGPLSAHDGVRPNKLIPHPVPGGEVVWM